MDIKELMLSINHAYAVVQRITRETYRLAAFHILPNSIDQEECRILACTLHFDHEYDADILAPLFSIYADEKTIRAWFSDEGKQRHIAKLRDMPYDEYLKTDHWLHVREAALERDGYRCRLCNSTERLNVHHRTYERRGEELPGDLTTLCQPCHESFHENGKLARPTDPQLIF